MTVINLGSSPGGAGGDSKRTAFSKVKTVIDGLDGQTGFVQVADGVGDTTETIPASSIATGIADISVSRNAQTATVGDQRAVRGPSTSTGSPNQNTRTSVGNLLTTGSFHTISPGIPFFGQINWNTSSPTSLNALEFPDIVCTPKRRRLIVGYARAGVESNYDGTTLAVTRISDDMGNTWADEVVQLRASDISNTATCGTGGLWSSTQNQGRIFLSLVSEPSSGAKWNQTIVYSDDDGDTWSDPFPLIDTTGDYSLFWFSSNKGVEIPDGLGPNGGGTLLMAGYGQNMSSNETDCTILKSLDGGETWVRQGMIFSGIGHGTTPRYAEPSIASTGGQNLVCLLRRTDNNKISICFSTDLGATWGSITDILDGIGRPSLIALQDGTLITFYRANVAGAPAYLSTSRNGGVTWEPPYQVDTRTTIQAVAGSNPPLPYFMAYGGLTEVSPGVVAAVYSAGSFGATFWDVIMTYLIDGKARDPLGNMSTMDLRTQRVGFYDQLPSDAPVLQLTTAADRVSVTTLANYLDNFVNAHIAWGLGLKSILDYPSLYGWYEPCQLAGTISQLDPIALLPDLFTAAGGSNGSGDLAQSTLANKPLYYQQGKWFNGQPVLANSSSHTWMQGSSYTPRTGPNTYVIIGHLAQSVGQSRGMFNVGSGADSIGLAGNAGLTTDGFAVSNNSQFFSAPTFKSYYSGAPYPQGPFILVLISNGASTKLYRDGILIASGTIGTTSSSQLTLGDVTNPTTQAIAHVSLYQTAFTAALIREIGRYAKNKFGVAAVRPN